MKNIIIISLLVLGIATGVSVPLASNVVHAEGYWETGPGYQYNFMFRFRGVDRYIHTNAQLQDFLQELYAYLQQLIDDRYTYDSEVEVATHSATDITADSARLHGEVLDFNDSDYATTWFEYGRSYSVLTGRTDSERIDDSDDGDFDREISNLLEDTRYYFRAVARDDRGENDYGSVLQFTTHDDGDGYDEPEVTTLSAINVTDDSATLRGTVDMSDFNNGKVFFVYGEDNDQVEDVADNFDTYADIDEDGEDLQKVLVDSDLDGQDTYSEEVENLDDNTKYYFSTCVGYEDEGGDEILECGSVRTFTTD
jgi:hypothetical protein